MRVKTIKDWNGLEEFGIRPLTGEADRTGQRMLCDVTEDGLKIVVNLLGLPGTGLLYESYNGRGAVGSMMLPYGLFKDLANWCLLFGKYKCQQVFAVVRSNGSLHASFAVIGKEADDDDEKWDEYLMLLLESGIEGRRIKIDTKQPGVGGRATHAMSGRTE
jgi:hypothetical protein